MIAVAVFFAGLVAYLYAVLALCRLLGRRGDQLAAWLGKEWGE